MTTIICDIDGVLFRHSPTGSGEKLSGTTLKLIEWQKKGYNLILITGRRESMRRATEQQLEKAHIAYDQLIMGVGPGQRYLINDRKEEGRKTAFAINLNRNVGIGKIDIDSIY